MVAPIYHVGQAAGHVFNVWSVSPAPDAMVTVRRGGSDAESGESLAAAYAAAKTLKPGGNPLSASNPATVLVPGGAWDISSAGDPAALNVLFANRFVHLVGMAPVPPLLVLAATCYNVVPWALGSICHNVRIASSDGAGGLEAEHAVISATPGLTPLPVQQGQLANIGFRLADPDGTGGRLGGTGFDAVDSTSEDITDDDYPADARKFTADNSDNIYKILARHTFSGATDLTGMMFRLDFEVHDEALTNLENLQFQFLHSSHQTLWRIWDDVSAFRSQIYGHHSISFTLSDYSYKGASFDPTIVASVAIRTSLAAGHGTDQPAVTIKSFRCYQAPTKLSVMVDFDDNRNTGDTIAGLHYAAAKGVPCTLYPIVRLLNNPTLGGVSGYHGWGELADLVSLGHRTAIHGFDHNTTYYMDHPDEMIFDMLAGRQEMIRRGFADGARILATPGGKWLYDPAWWGLFDYVRYTLWPCGSTSPQCGTLLDFPTGYTPVDHAANVAYGAKEQIASMIAAGDYGGGLVHVLLHNLQATAGRTLADFEDLCDDIATRVAAGTVQVITPHDYLSGGIDLS